MNNKEQTQATITEEPEVTQLYEITKSIMKNLELEPSVVSIVQDKKIMIPIYNKYIEDVHNIFKGISESDIDNIAQKISIKSINYIFRNVKRVCDISEYRKEELENRTYTTKIFNFVISEYYKYKNNM